MLRIHYASIITITIASLLLSFFVPLAHAENIEFLEKDVIKRLTKGVYEVVIPKSALESEKISYARELPFNKLSYMERNEKFLGIGTAFFINDQQLMSAAHIFGLEAFSLLQDDIAIRDTSGNIYPIKDVHEYSTVRDMIVFDLESYPDEVSPLPSYHNIEIGDTVFSVGNVQGEGISFRAGQVAAFTTEEEFGLWNNIRFTSPASPGNSGGPLVNIDGEVVGLIVQKNASENHNIAYPIKEKDRLSGNADFTYRNMGMYLNDEQNSLFKDWNASFILPKTVPDLAQAAQESFNEFHRQLGLALGEKYEETYFPSGERFRNYLRNQQFVRHFGTLESDADFKRWHVSSYRSKSIPLADDQDLVVSKSEIADVHLVIEKPGDVSLDQFISNPRMIMDTLLKGLPIKRDIGVEQVRVTSLGEPERSTTWSDRLGRVWTSSLWYITYEDSHIYTHCLPYPKGVICNLDLATNNELSLGYLDLIQQDYDEVVVGYTGEVKDWVEYFKLDKERLPKSMRNIQLSFDNDQFRLRSELFKISMNESDITETSNIHFHFGYASDELLSEDLLLYEVFPKQGDSTHYRIQKYHSPGAFSSDSYKAAWQDIMNRSGDYAGSLVEKEGTFYVNQPRPETQSTTEDDIKSILVVRCFHNKKSDDIVEQCNKHATAVEFF